MNRQELLERLQVADDALTLECMSVVYRFDFNGPCHHFDNRTLYEIGRNDVGIPIVVDPDSEHVYFLVPRGLSFINSSFRQLREAVSAVNADNIPDDISDSERARLFGEQMLEIDAHCFDDPQGIWAVMREEIGNGII